MLPLEDKKVLAQLAEAGDDPSIVRPVIHWFFGDESDLRAIAKSLGNAGWVNLDPRRDEDGWLSSPTKISDILEGSILQMNDEIEAASSDLEVTYDGWETSVEVPKKRVRLIAKLLGKS
jgi:regulator of RNase E activity RraB